MKHHGPFPNRKAVLRSLEIPTAAMATRFRYWNNDGPHDARDQPPRSGRCAVSVRVHGKGDLGVKLRGGASIGRAAPYATKSFSSASARSGSNNAVTLKPAARRAM